eukprot:4079155-Alexandrium_andersonii.AAC.1
MRARRGPRLRHPLGVRHPAGSWERHCAKERVRGPRDPGPHFARSVPLVDLPAGVERVQAPSGHRLPEGLALR